MTVSVQGSAVKSSIVSGNGNATCPSVNAGDLIVCFNTYWDEVDSTTPNPDAYPSGFTGIGSSPDASLSARLSYKIASGSEGGSAISGYSNGSGAGNEVWCMGLYTFRSTLPPLHTISVASISWPTMVATNPPGATVTASGGTPPLIVIGAYASGSGGSAVNPRTFSTTKDGEIDITDGGLQAYLAYKIYSASPANTTVDMDDEGNANFVGSCYIQVTETAPPGQPARKRGGGVPNMGGRLAPRGGSVWMPDRTLLLPDGFKRAA